MPVAGPKLLYVEDEVLIRELGITILEEAGFVVVAHADGRDAIAELDANGATFAALVTDIDLGGGPEGWVIAQHAREILPDLPVIYVSGGSANDWPSKGVPNSSILLKPYAAGQLVTAVSSATLSASRD